MPMGFKNHAIQILSFARLGCGRDLKIFPGKVKRSPPDLWQTSSCRRLKCVSGHYACDKLMQSNEFL
jgi:hypothetical protein